jgi:hypothetical protein
LDGLAIGRLDDLAKGYKIFDCRFSIFDFILEFGICLEFGAWCLVLGDCGLEFVCCLVLVVWNLINPKGMLENSPGRQSRGKEAARSI